MDPVSLSYQVKLKLIEPGPFVLQNNFPTVISIPNTCKYALKTMHHDSVRCNLNHSLKPSETSATKYFHYSTPSDHLNAIILKTNGSQYHMHAFICCFMSVFLSFAWMQWEFLTSSCASYEQKMSLCILTGNRVVVKGQYTTLWESQYVHICFVKVIALCLFL